jgi:glucokinase
MPQKTEDVAIGVDLGGTKIAACVGYLETGELLEDVVQMQTPKDSPQSVLEALREAIDEVIDMRPWGWSVGEEHFKGIGIGTPGPIDFGTGVVNAGNLPKGIKLGELREHYGGRVFWDNDLNAAARGEFEYGLGRQVRERSEPASFILFTFGTGIGGGIYQNGRLLEGNVEPGHIIVNPDSSARVCGCGSKGCWESECSGGNIAKKAREIYEGNMTPVMTDLTGGNTGIITAREVYEAARRGDGPAMEMIRKIQRYNVIGVASWVNSFMLPYVSFMGPTALKESTKKPDLFLEPLRYGAEGEFLGVPELAKLSGIKPENIMPTPLGENAGIYGGIALVKQMRGLKY